MKPKRPESLALDDLAVRISRLNPSMSRNPHAFYEERSEVAHLIRAVAEWLETGRRPDDLKVG